MYEPWIKSGKVFTEPAELPPVIEKFVITEWLYPSLTLEGFAEVAGKKTRVVLCCPASEDD